MTKINRDYIYIDEWNDLNKVILEPKSLYIYAHDPEDRSVFVLKNWRDIIYKQNL